MYTAQLQGFDIAQALECDYIDMEESLIGDLAKEIAVRQHGLPPKEQLQDEDLSGGPRPLDRGAPEGEFVCIKCGLRSRE